MGRKLAELLYHKLGGSIRKTDVRSQFNLRFRPIETTKSLARTRAHDESTPRVLYEHSRKANLEEIQCSSASAFLLFHPQLAFRSFFLPGVPGRTVSAY